MRMNEYLTKYDCLAYEDNFFNVPFRRDVILSQIGKGKRVLDIGCLGGKLSRAIMDQRNDVWAVEINPQAAEEAQKKGVRVKVANVEDGLPFDEGAFDFVNIGDVLEYLYDTKYFLQECRRVLRKDGKILVTTPNLNSLENRVRMFKGEYPSMLGAYPEDHFGESIRLLNLSKLDELLNATGFKRTETRGLFSFESHGKWVDKSMGLVGRYFPGLSKLLMVTAQKVKS